MDTGTGAGEDPRAETGAGRELRVCIVAEALAVLKSLLEDPQQTALTMIIGTQDTMPRPKTYNAEQAAGIIGGNCKASWLKAQCRKDKIPYTKLGGSYHFTDEQIVEILRIFEVPARRGAVPAPPTSRAPSARRPVLPDGVPLLEMRPPRKRRDS